ncbi:MAG: gamma carbonic anhydrase family protein [Firmicutes bacterium]|nr:gamma carbonic anhydrase family protein [Bacillota bacterium]
MILEYDNKKPSIHNKSFVAKSADLIGDVTLKENSSIWFNCVLRADKNSIFVGKCSNIQDGSVVHISKEHSTIIGNYVTIGHNVTVHACKIADNVLIGMGAIILDGVEIEENVLIGAGSVVTPGKKIPSGSLVLGSPARVVRKLTDEEIDNIKQSAYNYKDYVKKYSKNY